MIATPFMSLMPQPMREAVLVDEALMEWRKRLYDRGLISFERRMEMAHGHRRFLETDNG